MPVDRHDERPLGERLDECAGRELFLVLNSKVKSHARQIDCSSNFDTVDAGECQVGRVFDRFRVDGTVSVPTIVIVGRLRAYCEGKKQQSEDCGECGVAIDHRSGSSSFVG